MIARNVNGLLENVSEMRADLVSDRRDLKNDAKRLDARLFKLHNDLEKVARSHDKFMEEMTSVAFDTNLEVRGALNAIEAIWNAMGEIAPKSRKTINEKKREAEEREKRRVAAIDKKLQELASSPTKKRKVN